MDGSAGGGEEWAFSWSGGTEDYFAADAAGDFAVWEWGEVEFFCGIEGMEAWAEG